MTQKRTIWQSLSGYLVALLMLGGGFFALTQLLKQPGDGARKSNLAAPVKATAKADTKPTIPAIVPAPQPEKDSATPLDTAPAAAVAAITTDTAADAAVPQPAAESKPAPIPYENPLTPEEQAEGWLSLFDGHTLFGFSSNNSEVNWSVAEGAITADQGPIGLLLTAVPFADYELKCDFRMSEGGNSGIFLRTVKDPQDVKADCYELNIADSHPAGFTTGAIVGHKPTEQPIIGSGGWKTFHVTVSGNQIKVSLDGTQVLDFTDETNARRQGLIGLQKNVGKIEFKKILLRPLGLQSMFNEQDLTGWRAVPGSKSTFTVKDGTIHCRGGQGFIETEREYGDFIVQIDSRTHAVNLNSGFFFRAQPGSEKTPSNGYEVQIDNSTKDGDRHQPANSGTGAIFRRVEARYVVASDDEWCTTTLVASGPHFAVWVNGYAVVDWEDTRPPDDNPRKGQRLAPGHISLQGHDPTTDVSFRRLQIGELAQ